MIPPPSTKPWAICLSCRNAATSGKLHPTGVDFFSQPINCISMAVAAAFHVASRKACSNGHSVCVASGSRMHASPTKSREPARSRLSCVNAGMVPCPRARGTFFISEESTQRRRLKPMVSRLPCALAQTNTNPPKSVWRVLLFSLSLRCARLKNAQVLAFVACASTVLRTSLHFHH